MWRLPAASMQADRCESARCKITRIRGSGRLAQALALMKRIFILCFCACLDAGITAARASDYPDEIIGYYRAAHKSCIYMGPIEPEVCNEVFDTIEIAPRNTSSLYVGIDTRGANAHGCVFDGIGRWEGNKLSVTAQSPRTHKFCRISVHFSGDGAFYKIAEADMLLCFGHPTKAEFCSALGELDPDTKHQKHSRGKER
jgi:hypothetical protein